MIRSHLLVATAALFITVPAIGHAAPKAAAVAQTSTSPAPPLKGFTAFGVVAWHGFGVGGRYMLPLPIPSVLPKRGPIRDAWALEFGGDIVHSSYSYGSRTYSRSYGYTEIRPVVGMMWQVWINPKFMVYPKAEAGYGFGRFSGWDDNWGGNGSFGYGGTYLDASGGLLYKTDGGLMLRAEAGWHSVRGGLAFLF
jgi:hypothetical protein